MLAPKLVFTKWMERLLAVNRSMMPKKDYNSNEPSLTLAPGKSLDSFNHLLRKMQMLKLTIMLKRRNSKAGKRLSEEDSTINFSIMPN